MTLLLTYDPIGDLSQVPRPLGLALGSRWRVGLLHAAVRPSDHGWAVCIGGSSFRHTVKRLLDRGQAHELCGKLQQIINAAVVMAGADHV